MSTRRARIKAVAALPQRRKNAGNTVQKAKEQIKEVEILLKSPKDGRAALDKHSSSSPARVAPSLRKCSPRKSPRAPRTPDVEKVSSDWKVPTPNPVLQENRSNTPLRDRSGTNKTPRADVFVSPPARGSPRVRRSPVVRLPVVEVEVGPEKLITPHKRLTELQDTNKHKASENKDSLLPKRNNHAAASNSDIGIKNVVGHYNSPTTPENNVMDGIVPLKPVSNAPKPIDMLKHEIISENAEVLFDPIIPLPSPTKVRQKLRPVPRLGPMRRNSIPGSASESEDESRRAFHGGSSTPVLTRQRHDSHTSHSTMSHPNRDVNRVRNDSMCSSLMAPHTPAPGSPMREKSTTKSRRVDVSRRMAAIRRRKESIQREKLTMFDLIFYNPIGNPIIPDQDELKAKEATKKEEEERKLVNSKKEETNEESNEATVDTAAPVPQIKLGPNGEIILDEQSLVIKQSERKLSESVVREGAWMSSTGRVYRRAARTADWSNAETVRFYRALAALGTDFSLMVALFPGRTRRDLKLKFKKEERANLAQIDKALRSNSEWDPEQLESEFANERKEDEENARKDKERQRETERMHKEQLALLKNGKRKSKGIQLLGMSAIPTNPITPTANSILDEAMKAKKRKQKPTHSKRRPHSSNLDLATLTPTNAFGPRPKLPKVGIPLGPANVHKSHSMLTPPTTKSPVVLNALPAVPADIAPGSLVVLTVDDPKAPSQKAIHTYIKQADGSIASIILQPSVMSSLVNIVKKDTPRAGSMSSMSPSSVASDRTNTPPVGASPSKRKRHVSYTITNL